MIEKLKKEEQDMVEAFISKKISLGNVTTSIVDFIKDYKLAIDKLKDLDREYWQERTDLVAKASLNYLMDTLKDFLKNPVILNMGIQNHPHGTILNSFKVAYDEIGKLEMSIEQTKYYNDQVELFQKMSTVLKSESSEGKSGCYVATMAYGDYDHPQVLELRNFRDNVLSKNYFGRSFIKFYYAVSPQLVILLKNNVWVNRQIRKMLDELINKLKK
jgi:hypothetical protein